MFTTEKDSNLCDIGALHPLWTTHSYIFRQVEATPGCGLTSWQIEIRISWSSNFNDPFSILVSWTHNDSTCKEYGKNSLSPQKMASNLKCLTNFHQRAVSWPKIPLTSWAFPPAFHAPVAPVPGSLREGSRARWHHSKKNHFGIFPWKLTWQREIIVFNRRYIFKCLVFHGQSS